MRHAHIQALNAMIQESHRNFLINNNRYSLGQSSTLSEIYELAQSAQNISPQAYLNKLFSILDRHQQRVKESQISNTLKAIQNESYTLECEQVPFHQNQCSLSDFILCLSRKAPQYSKQEVKFYNKLIRSYGLIFRNQNVRYFEIYFEGMEIEKYTVEFIQLLIAFILALPTAIQNTFKEKYSLHLHKNHKTLNKILGSNNVEGQTKVKSSSVNMDTLSMLFHLFYELERNHEKICRFVNNFTFESIFSKVYEYQHNIYPKTAFLLFLNCHTHKLIKFSLLKKEGHRQDKHFIQSDPDEQRIFEWIAATNDFIQREIDLLSNTIISDKEHLNYFQALIELIQQRVEAFNNFQQMKTFSLLRNKMLLDFPSLDCPPHMLKTHSSQSEASHLETSELEKVSNFNRMMVFDLVDKIDKSVVQDDLNQQMCKKLYWLEGQFGVHFQKIPLNLIEHHQTKFCYYSAKQGQLRGEDNELNATRIQDASNYLVLILQLLERNVAPKLDQEASEQMDDPSQQQQILDLLYRLDLCLQKQIAAYLEKAKELQKQLYNSLPVRYEKMSELENGAKENSQLSELKCCSLDRFYIQTLFDILLRSFRVNKHKIVSFIHKILSKLVCHNIQNKKILQQEISQYYILYYKVLLDYIITFRQCSPIVNPKNFILNNLMTEQRSYIFGESLLMASPSERQRLVDKYCEEIMDLEVCSGYQEINDHYQHAMNFVIVMSSSIYAEFKMLLSVATIQHQPIMYELLSLFEQLSQHLQLVNRQKLKCMKQLAEVILVLMRGPIQNNINICINSNYPTTIQKVLTYSYNLQNIEAEELNGQLIKTKQLLAQSLFILIPSLQNDLTDLVENQLEQAYVSSRRSYSSNYEDIIIDYANPTKNQNDSVLYFSLALHFFYCLFQLYHLSSNSTITKFQHGLYQEEELKKKHLKNWKMFYQLYRVLADIASSIYHRLSSTYEDYTLDRSHEELLERSISFFSKHVASIQISVGPQVKKVSFLKLKEAQCLTHSIRKELRRLTSSDERTLRLTNLMAVSKYIIMRLEVQKSILYFLERFKPIELIVKNKELWKNLNFVFVIVLNYFYIFEVELNDSLSVTIKTIVVNFLLSVIYLLLVFLLLSFIFEVIPLKLKLYHLINREKFKALSLFVFLNDKTLFYCLVFVIVVSMAFQNLAWISILTLDFFFRFKTSIYITSLLYRTIAQIFYVILFIFALIFVSSLIEQTLNLQPYGCLTPSACTQQNFSIIMRLQFNLFQLVENIELWRIFAHAIRFFTHMIIISLIVGLIFIEKIADNREFEERQFLKKSRCFICHLTRNQIEKKKNSKEGFEIHIETEHNLWNYLYYLIYLKNKEKYKLNSLQKLVLQKWVDNQIDWLPSE